MDITKDQYVEEKPRVLKSAPKHRKISLIQEAFEIRHRRRKLIERLLFTCFRGAAVLNGLALAVIVFFMLKNGISAVTWEFLTDVPRDAMTRGGILPCIVGTILLGLSRAAGETAPIMFTAAVFYTPDLPESIFDEIMALPYHIYVLATAGTHIEETRHLQYGTALVLIALVLGMNMVAILWRSRLRRKLK